MSNNWALYLLSMTPPQEWWSGFIIFKLAGNVKLKMKLQLLYVSDWINEMEVKDLPCIGYGSFWLATLYIYCTTDQQCSCTEWIYLFREGISCQRVLYQMPVLYSGRHWIQFDHIKKVKRLSAALSYLCPAVVGFLQPSVLELQIQCFTPPSAKQPHFREMIQFLHVYWTLASATALHLTLGLSLTSSRSLKRKVSEHLVSDIMPITSELVELNPHVWMVSCWEIVASV